MQQKEREREVKVTEAQKLVIIDFMEQNEDFAKGKLLTAENKKTWANLWGTLTRKLNRMNGAQKSTTKWQRAWSDLKNKVKRKAKEIRQLRLKGEWPQTSIKLTDFEERLISFVADETVYGLKGFDSIVMEAEDPLSGDVTPLIKPEYVDDEIIFTDAVHYCSNNKIHEETISVSPITTITSDDQKADESSSNEDTSKPEESLRKKLDNLTDIGNELIKEHRKTNEILRELIDVLKQKK